MDMSNDTSICRLCRIKLQDRKSKHIFDKETDLVHKINDTLSFKINPDDNLSEYICLDCYERVCRHYDFMQNVLGQKARESVSMPKMNSLCELNKNKTLEATILSKLHNDMIYTCPNCNIDLMIIIRSNPEGCNYAFHISLAVVDQMEKFEKEVNTHICENSKDLDESCVKKTNVGTNVDNEFESSYVILNDTKESTNEVDESSPLLEENVNCVDTYDVLPMENVTCPTGEDVKEESKKDDICKTSDSPSKSQNLKPKLDTTVCESDGDLLNCDYDCVDGLIKIESVSNEVEWFNDKANDEVDCKESTIYMTETKKERVDEDSTKCEDFDVKSCPKIVCNLCGIRYLSQMKYEFHMERHKMNKMDKFVCTMCDKEASNENLLWDHYYHTHKSSVRYACMECGKLYMKKPRLKGHQKRYKHFGIKELHFEPSIDKASVDQKAQKTIEIEIRRKRNVNCSLCRKPITDLNPNAINDLVTCAACEDSTLSLMVDGSEMKVISPRQYHCSKCSKHFVYKERLEFHEMRHNENMNEFVCSTCGKEFSAENSLYEHYLFVHKGARPHICELCGKSFQLKTRLKEHHRTHTGERPYQCYTCGQRCMTTNALKLHKKTHFSHNRYTCEICGKSFSKKQNMNEHLEKHWKNDKNVSLPQLFTCPVCNEDLPTYRMLKYHLMETHQIDRQNPLLTQQKPWYECNECHEKFKHQMSLKAHKEKVHEGRVSPTFECNTCKATYKIKQLLINHIRSKHDGEKRYKCAQCCKGFNDTKSLYNHILLHTGRKPFQCEYCNVSFRRKDSRDHHRRKHTGEQPYQCSDCGETFSTYNNRSKHRKKEHGKGETKCPECGQRCNSQQEVRIHLNKHLGEKLNKLRLA